MPPTSRRIYLPERFAVRGKIGQNLIEQIEQPAGEEDALLDIYARKSISGLSLQHSNGSTTIVVNRGIGLPKNTNTILVVPNGSLVDDIDDFRSGKLTARWHLPKPVKVNSQNASYWSNRCDQVRESWKGQFFFKEESRDGQGSGLRPPQVGALHAVLAHWKVTESPATVVMPTGTGKTETMLALLVRERLQCLLVIVPTNALREQISRKFKSLGVLKKLGVIGPSCLYPIVGVLTKRPTTTAQVDEVFARCNVVVTTMSVASGCSNDIQIRMADLSSHLFIDEAHHVPAPSWNKFRKHFKEKPIVQFTATPFRTDGKHVDGKVVFNYPLRKAQAEGYFKPIRFRAINEFSPEFSDNEIARVAIEQLETDLSASLDHIVMARVANIRRAEIVHQIYTEIGSRYNPLLIHSALAGQEQKNALQRLINRETRIVICVQMLGEGFDLPELKIAALHDVHKSLAITLQFTGRFTRTKDTIGDATVIANIATPGVEDSLRDLYAEDADWNAVLRVLSEGATGRQTRRSEFLDDFQDVPEEIPLQNIFPKMSTVVYKTRCARWRPERAADTINETRLFADPTINPKHNVVLFITRETEPVPWGAVREVQNIEWHLYLLHWNKDLNLLFINSSNNASRHEDIAKSVAGEEIELVYGEQIFRSLHGVNYLILMNLGLNHAISRAVRFTMYMGSDVASALRDPELQNKIKSNLFGKGYENGGKTSIGCSRKGRIWSYRIAYDMAEWVEWCAGVGTKLIDNSITTDSVFRNVIKPERITERPALVPLAIEWPDDFLERPEHLIQISIGNELVPFIDAGLDIINPSREGTIRFRVSTLNNSAEYEVRFEEGRVTYAPTGTITANVILGRKQSSLNEVFQDNWPIIRFENGGFLNYDELCVPPNADNRTPYDRNSIQVWDWTNTDIRKEAQTFLKHPNSIQFRLIRELRESGRYEVIFNDDGSNEIADVIGLRIEGNKLLADLYHCKYSGTAAPGARVDDLYVVCGQAQRSVYWKGNVERMFNRMRHREDLFMRRNRVSRFEQGNLSVLADIYNKSHSLIPEFNVFIVQPGLSKSQAINSQLELLAATDMYLNETYAVKLSVIASE
jgi:superfamily II DNA or RNA helicase